VLFCEVPHPPPVRGEPVHPGSVPTEVLPVKVGRAVVLDADAPPAVSEVEPVERIAELVRHPLLGFRHGQPAIDQHQA
jgi:hypothetical protein